MDACDAKAAISRRGSVAAAATFGAAAVMMALLRFLIGRVGNIDFSSARLQMMRNARPS
jgi:hypothetical protein